MTECECGNPKGRGAKCCDRCRYLDGERPKQALVICTLRGTDGMSLGELTRHLYNRDDRTAWGAMRRTLQALEARGRVRRYWRENDKHAVKERDGACGRIKFGGSGCWVYALDERVARAA